jgi:uncharacterized protein (TIGR03437 family)
MMPVALTVLVAPLILLSGSLGAEAPNTIPTDPNLKVAFIGDSGNGTDFRSVLQLIANEGAHIVLHQGDFDYSLDADGFFATIDSILGPNFPYFASVGNHDIDSWPTGCSDSDGCYAQFLKDRMARIGVTPDDPNLNDQMYAVTFRGLKLVFVGQNGVSAGDNTYAPYIQGQLSADDHIWKICSWHKNQRAMQVGGKSDEMGWRVYETCKDLGAIIATAHEHSYHRTRTLTSMQNQTVDSSCSDPSDLCVGPGAPGKSFVFVSGLGGRSIRDQERCLPTTFPYGCNGEWAKIYTSDQGARYGALFITFHVGGTPTLAHGYFKNINGEVVDEFDIRADTGVPPGPSTINSGGVTNGASFTNQPLAAGSIASVFGSNLATFTAAASGTPLPTTLAGATLQFNATQPVPKFYASAAQINFQLPWELAGLSSAPLTDTVGGVSSNAETVNLATFSPGIFSTNQTGSGQGAVLIADTGGAVAAPVGMFPGSRPVVRGTESIEIFCTGLGPVTNQPPTGSAAGSSPLSLTTATPLVNIGGVPATVSFSGLAPGFVGLYQVNVQVPAGAPSGDAIPVVLSINGVTSNTVTIAVQ